jgi:hypothetical protein
MIINIALQKMLKGILHLSEKKRRHKLRKKIHKIHKKFHEHMKIREKIKHVQLSTTEKPPR